MKIRSRARDVALQYLYQVDITSDHSEKAVEDFLNHFVDDENVKPYARDLIKGVFTNLTHLDHLIDQAAQNWRMSRMSTTDRNILRISTYELTCRSDIPYKVAINEGVELAKRFGSPKCPAFVNGVLDKVRLMHDAAPVE
jgi:transcription antitermination protein NusB